LGNRFEIPDSTPGVRIEMEFADRYVDLVEERFDLAIRSGPEGRADKLIGRRLLDAPRCLFASPDYLKSHGTPRTVSDLKNHMCVILGSRADRVTWQIHIGKRIQNVIVHGPIAVNEARLAAECAADGFGIAFLPQAICAKHVNAGRLKRVLPRVSAGEWVVWSRLSGSTLASNLPCPRGVSGEGTAGECRDTHREVISVCAEAKARFSEMMRDRSPGLE